MPVILEIAGLESAVDFSFAWCRSCGVMLYVMLTASFREPPPPPFSLNMIHRDCTVLQNTTSYHANSTTHNCHVQPVERTNHHSRLATSNNRFVTLSAAFRRLDDSLVHGVKRMHLMFDRILSADYVPIEYVRLPTHLTHSPLNSMMLSSIISSNGVNTYLV